MRSPINLSDELYMVSKLTFVTDGHSNYVGAAAQVSSLQTLFHSSKCKKNVYSQQ